MNWQPIATVPKDGTWFIASWEGKTVPAKFLDNSKAEHGPWQGFVVPSMWPRPHKAVPERWMPFPAPATTEDT